MTTVAQLIAHLQTLPQEAEVKCLSEECAYIAWKELNIDDDITVMDLRGNEFVKIGCIIH